MFMTRCVMLNCKTDSQSEVTNFLYKLHMKLSQKSS